MEKRVIWQDLRKSSCFIRGVKAARGSGAENILIGQPPKVVGQDHNFQWQESRLNTIAKVYIQSYLMITIPYYVQIY